MHCKYNRWLLIKAIEMPAVASGPTYHHYMKGAVGAFLVYDITRRYTYEQVKLLVPILKKYHQNDPYFQIVLVGNKIYLCISDYRKREVLTDELKAFTTSVRVNYWETSAIYDAYLKVPDSLYGIFFKRIYVARIDNTIARGIRTHVGDVMPSIKYKGKRAGAGNLTDYAYLFKVLVLGSPHVGKSNLVSRFMKNEFNLNYIPTYGYELSTGSMVVDGKVILAQICDVAGQGRYKPSVLDSRITYNVGNPAEGVSGILYVYDVANRISFENLKSHDISAMRLIHGPDIPIMLVGNKTDPYSGPRFVNEIYRRNGGGKTDSGNCPISRIFKEICRRNGGKATEKINLGSSTSDDGSNLATQLKGKGISNNEAPKTTRSGGISGAKDRNNQASIPKAGPSMVQGIAAIDGGEVNLNNAENNLNFGTILNNNFNFGKKRQSYDHRGR